MAKCIFHFENTGEADAFMYGIEYGGVDAIHSMECRYDPNGGVVVILEDDDMEEDYDDSGLVGFDA